MTNEINVPPGLDGRLHNVLGELHTMFRELHALNYTAGVVGHEARWPEYDEKRIDDIHHAIIQFWHMKTHIVRR